MQEGRGRPISGHRISPYKDKYRLYYCVSAFGRKTSYIGLAESTSPEGPWTQKGCIVKTDDSTAMNAIDPSVIADENTGKWWMHYGSFFGGLYCVELNPETGLALNEGRFGAPCSTACQLSEGQSRSTGNNLSSGAETILSFHFL